MSDSEKGLTLDLPLALEYAKRWRNSKDKYKYEALHGFQMSIMDLEAILGENASGVRLYLGINDKNEAKIMLVGTVLTQHGDGTITHDDMLPKMAQTGNVYDFSMPCPKACSSVSPFNNL